MFKSYAATAITGLFALDLAGPAFAATSGETQEQTALRTRSTTDGRQSIRRGHGCRSRQARVVVETNGPKGMQIVIVDAQNRQIVGGHPGSEAD